MTSPNREGFRTLLGKLVDIAPLQVLTQETQKERQDNRYRQRRTEVMGVGWSWFETFRVRVHESFAAETRKLRHLRRTGVNRASNECLIFCVTRSYPGLSLAGVAMLRFACSRIPVSCRHQLLLQHASRAWVSSSTQEKWETFDNSPVLQVVRRKMDQRSELQSQVHLSFFNLVSMFADSCCIDLRLHVTFSEQARHEATDSDGTVVIRLGGMVEDKRGLSVLNPPPCILTCALVVPARN